MRTVLKDQRGAGLVEYGITLALIGAMGIPMVVNLGGEIGSHFDTSRDAISLTAETAPEGAASEPAAPVWNASFEGSASDFPGQYTKAFSVYMYDEIAASNASGPPSFLARVAARSDGLSGVLTEDEIPGWLQDNDEMNRPFDNLAEYMDGTYGAMGASMDGGILAPADATLCSAVDPGNFNPLVNAGIANVSLENVTMQRLTPDLIPPQTRYGRFMMSFDGGSGGSVGGTLDQRFEADGFVDVISTFRCVRDALPGDDPVTGQM